MTMPNIVRKYLRWFELKREGRPDISSLRALYQRSAAAFPALVAFAPAPARRIAGSRAPAEHSRG